MGKAWNIIQGWVDSQPVEITDAQLSRALGVAQSNFDIWKNPKKLPAHEALGAIATLTQQDYRAVLEAFIEDIGYADPPTDEQMERRRMARARPQEKIHKGRRTSDAVSVTKLDKSAKVTQRQDP